MKRTFIPLSLIAALALPATASAAPTQADKQEGKRECRQLQRVVETRSNFVQVVRLEAKAKRRNAFGRCVEVRSDDATGERRTAFRQAKEACASLRPTRASQGRPDPGSTGRPTDPGRPADPGIGGRPTDPGRPADPGSRSRPADPGAYGRCVSAAARAKAAESDAEQRKEALNPARTCRGKQEADLGAFKAEFPGKNGFGKCVSQVAKAQNDDAQEPGAAS